MGKHNNMKDDLKNKQRKIDTMSIRSADAHNQKDPFRKMPSNVKEK